MPNTEDMNIVWEKNRETTVKDIARVCHQVNKAVCEAQGDTSQTNWETAPDWQKNSAVDGVKFHLANPDASPSSSHENWLKDKEKDGWKYGPIKNVEKKEHPCYVPYDDLPFEQKVKDYVFKAIVASLNGE